MPVGRSVDGGRWTPASEAVAAIFSCGLWVAGIGGATAQTAGVDQFIVTGDRRARALAETPRSVASLSNETIRLVGADHASELLNRAPGVFVHRGSGQEHLTAIRSPVLTGGAGAGSFLFLQDGVPLRAAGFANVNGLFEAHTEIAERIEVGRGPSGALYGANAIHGVINVLTPSPTTNAARLAISGDTIGRVKGVGEAEYVSGDNGFFTGLSILDDPGFRADSGVDQQKLTLRHERRGDRLSIATVFSGVNLNQETAGFVQGDDAYLDAALRRTNPNPEAFRDVRSARLSSRIEWRASDLVTVQVTPFVRWTDMDFLLHFLPSQALEQNSHWSLGAQTAVYFDADGPIRAIAGFDIDRTEGDLSEVQSIPTIFSFTQGVHYDYEVDSLALSPFARIEWRLSPRLTAQAAARLDYTRYDYDNLTDDGVVGRFLRPPDRADNFTTVSPKASLLYDLGGQTIYASYSRGARPPQTTDLYRLQISPGSDLDTADLEALQLEARAEPETIDAVEIGWRGAAGPLRFDLAGYFMVKDNFFFRDADGFNVPDGRTRHVGGEAEVSLDLPAGLRFDGQTAYGRHTYRFDRAIASVVQAGEAIAFGDDVDTAPRWLSNARASWRAADGATLAEVEWSRVGRYFMDAANSVVYPGHNIVNLRGERRLSSQLSVFAALRNVANTFYAERADFAFRNERYFPGEGRVLTVGLRLGA